MTQPAEPPRFAPRPQCPGGDRRRLWRRARGSLAEAWRRVLTRRLATALAFALLGLAAACSRPPIPPAAPALAFVDGATMGTTWSLQFADDVPVDRAALLAAVEAALAEVNGQLSTWQPDSAISRYNRADAGTWHDLPPGFTQVLGQALDLAQATGGAYDPTVGPLVALWGFGAGGAPRTTPPDAKAIADARARVGWQRLQFDRRSGRLLQPGGVALDLSSIGEGHGLDRIAAVAAAFGLRAVLVEIGGEVRAVGHRPDGSPWRVAIEDPLDAGAAPRVLPLVDAAVATSGDYRAAFVHAGRRFSHTLDPATGWPVDHGLAAVSVVAGDSARAGALATALSVLGPVSGLAFAEDQGIAARFVVREGTGARVVASAAFIARFGAP